MVIYYGVMDKPFFLLNITKSCYCDEDCYENVCVISKEQEMSVVFFFNAPR